MKTRHTFLIIAFLILSYQSAIAVDLTPISKEAVMKKYIEQFANKKNSKINIDAKTFKWNGSTETVYAVGDVKVIGDGYQITSRKAAYGFNTENLYFDKNVKLIQDTMVIQANKATAQKGLITANGNVRFYFEDITGKSGKALFNQTEQMVTLQDNPQVYKGNDLIKGQELVVNLKTKQVYAKGRSKLKAKLDSLNKPKE